MSNGEIAIENLTDMATQHRAERDYNARNFGRFSAAIAGLALALSPSAVQDAEASQASSVPVEFLSTVSASELGSEAVDCPRDKVVIIAHRGMGVGTRTINGVRYTEDTIPALRYGVKAGADGFETDYLRSKDNYIISNHDDTLNRTTTGTGRVRDRRLSYIKTLSKVHADSYKNVPVPTLGEVQKALAHLNSEQQVELKPALVSGLTTEKKEEILKKVVNAVKRNMGDDFYEKSLFTASELSTLRIVNSIDPLARTGYIKRGEGVPDLSKMPGFIDVLMVDYQSVTANYVDQAALVNKIVSARGVNSLKVRNNMISKGVKRIVTDRPGAVGGSC